MIKKRGPVGPHQSRRSRGGETRGESGLNQEVLTRLDPKETVRCLSDESEGEA